tara:strand:+ start:136 stop:486 length:351 start_codon:yes stop_codon:yes gene_type:complete
MSGPKSVYVLITPLGQLSGDGQLLESFRERRDRKGSDYPMWYLSPELIKEFDISNKENYEAVVSEESLVIAWLKLRFGGERLEKRLDIMKLREVASNLPPSPERRDIALDRKSSNK